MGSSRFPGKVLKEVCGKTLLELMMERVISCQSVDDVVVITTNEPADDAIVNLCIKNGWDYFRGSTSNLLERHYLAALQFNAKHIVKIPSDCPLIDPKVIDKVIYYYFDNSFDYVSNLHPQSYPDGNDVEIMPFEVIQKAMQCATKDFEFEHTTPYIWNSPSEFKIGNVKMNDFEDFSEVYRYTLDYFEDYLFIAALFEALYENGKIFSLEDIIALLKKDKQLLELNKMHIGVNWYKPFLNELNI